jgi:glucosamine-6-phosphate deaminase
MMSSSNHPPSVRVFDRADQASAAIAGEVAADVLRLRQQGRAPVLGLPTGATPETIYQEWSNDARDRGFSWKGVVTFNLDEYWPMEPSSRHSYRRFMNQKLFEPAGFDLDLTHVPDGTLEREGIDQYCMDYESAIQSSGGIDVQLLGIGVNGHLGFNEPDSDPKSRTRLVELAACTRQRAQPSFGNDEVPGFGISMGLGTIIESRKIYLLAFGAAKADAIRAALHGPVQSSCPGSLLQNHPQVEWVLDADAAALLG